MSADNWTQCPRCVAKRDGRNEKLSAKLETAYGTVPLEEWLNLRDRTQRDINEPIENTFRENWDIGVADGEFLVHYRGSCGTCKLRFEFKHGQTVSLDGAS